jgi:hypothetical protein
MCESSCQDSVGDDDDDDIPDLWYGGDNSSSDNSSADENDDDIPDLWSGGDDSSYDDSSADDDDLMDHFPYGETQADVNTATAEGEENEGEENEYYLITDDGNECDEFMIADTGATVHIRRNAEGMFDLRDEKCVVRYGNGAHSLWWVNGLVM